MPAPSPVGENGNELLTGELGESWFPVDEFPKTLTAGSPTSDLNPLFSPGWDNGLSILLLIPWEEAGRPVSANLGRRV